MPNKYTQENREAAVKIDGLAEDNLLLKSMVGMDKVGQPFNYIVEMLKNPGAEVKISSLVGKKLTITLNSIDLAAQQTAAWSPTMLQSCLGFGSLRNLPNVGFSKV
jgi:uncharacterized protein involved in type VI secretion and phage assembly